MNRFIDRDNSRLEHDDYVLNVQPYEGKYKESLPIYENNVLVGWIIKPRFE